MQKRLQEIVEVRKGEVRGKEKKEAEKRRIPAIQ